MGVIAPLIGTTNQVVEFRLLGSVLQSNGLYRVVSNLFHYKNSAAAPITLDTKQQLMTAFIAHCWTGKLQAALNQAYTLPVCQVRFVDNPEDPYEIALVAPGDVTGPATDREPLNTCITVQKLSGLRGRQNRGSFHFGPMSEADDTEDELAANKAVWQAAAAVLKDNITGAGGTVLNPIILRRQGSVLDKAPTTIYYAPFVQVILDWADGTMKKRKEKPALHGPRT